MKTRILAALVDCDAEREGPAAMEPICLEFTLISLGHGSLLVPEPFWASFSLRVSGKISRIDEQVDGITAESKGPITHHHLYFSCPHCPLSNCKHLLGTCYIADAVLILAILHRGQGKKSPVFLKLAFLEDRGRRPDNEQVKS